MTTRRRAIEPQTAQRLTVLAVTGALLVAGVALANTAGGSDNTASMQVIRTERVLETASPTAEPVSSTTPGTGLFTPGQTARPLDPPTPPAEPAAVPDRVAPAQKSTPPVRGGKTAKPEKPKPDAEAPKDSDGDDHDDHETVKPPVRDEDDDDDSDSDAPKTNDGKSDGSERQVRRQGE